LWNLNGMKVKAMKLEVISVKEAIGLIRNNKFTKHYKVDFKNLDVEALDAILLGKHGVVVPEERIIYNDLKIDFSDNPEITDQDIADGKLKWFVKTEIPLDAEIREWIGTENINLGEFAAKLIQNFYENIKTLPKRKAV